jgi:hypothetical protein
VGSVKFKIGDLVTIEPNPNLYEGAFVDEIGFVSSMPYTSFSYITFFNDPDHEILFKNSEISLYNPLDG